MSTKGQNGRKCFGLWLLKRLIVMAWAGSMDLGVLGVHKWSEKRRLLHERRGLNNVDDDLQTKWYHSNAISLCYVPSP